MIEVMENDGHWFAWSSLDKIDTEKFVPLGPRRDFPMSHVIQIRKDGGSLPLYERLSLKDKHKFSLEKYMKNIFMYSNMFSQCTEEFDLLDRYPIETLVDMDLVTLPTIVIKGFNPVEYEMRGTLLLLDIFTIINIRNLLNTNPMVIRRVEIDTVIGISSWANWSEQVFSIFLKTPPRYSAHLNKLGTASFSFAVL